MKVENQTVEQQEKIGMTDGDDRNELQPSCIRPFDGWVDVIDAPVNGNYDWEVGDKAIAFGGYVFEIEWDGDCWCSIGGDDFTHWMRYSSPKVK